MHHHFARSATEIMKLHLIYFMQLFIRLIKCWIKRKGNCSAEVYFGIHGQFSSLFSTWGWKLYVGQAICNNEKLYAKVIGLDSDFKTLTLSGKSTLCHHKNYVL